MTDFEQAVEQVQAEVGQRATDIVMALTQAGIPVDDLTVTALAMHVINRLMTHLMYLEEAKAAELQDAMSKVTL